MAKLATAQKKQNFVSHLPKTSNANEDSNSHNNTNQSHKPTDPNLVLTLSGANDKDYFLW